MSKQVVLITGANTGLGLEAVKALAKSEDTYEILIGARDHKKGEDAVRTAQQEVGQCKSTINTVQVDISSDESIDKLRDEITSRYGKLDALVNNAGANFDHSIRDGKMSRREGWIKSWDTNVAGTMVLTHELVPLLLKSSNPRLIFITSGTSTLTETESQEGPILQALNAPPEAGWPKNLEKNPTMAYRSSKCGLNMAMREWHRMLYKDDVKVFAVSPGFLATGLAGVGREQLVKVSHLDRDQSRKTIS